MTVLIPTKGGAVATAACPLVQKEVADVAGLTVIDVVEGKQWYLTHPRAAS